ncbi:hypothetical protein F4808DRAFT_461839 [Astrocystis sublimbata]|nr:hypothetical protein F4808DRAFT_461839 [Astrocystis sublimbata]
MFAIFSFLEALAQARESSKHNVVKHDEDVKARPKIESYLASDKRQNATADAVIEALLSKLIPLYW